ncbi:1,4-dihydroxy-2-naphthoate polyprenyltransferase [Planctomonas deserti]|uniref:1,4-dihydroxy-2-naphthoate polyprenyltransferase n=1 Tax=Planctomonas deserti TaxID=2144185 RepID=UPI0027D21C85|nr:1,4-dihydroxy-2-naphthoate polyprenyltransferase [Planctomonas deserti]
MAQKRRPPQPKTHPAARTRPGRAVPVGATQDGARETPHGDRGAAPARSGARSARSGRPGGKPVAPKRKRKATARDWIGGARLRTLPLSLAPVAIGTGAALLLDDGQWRPLLTVLCFAVAVFLQIGVNYANDYSDGVRGTDAHRVGPARLTGAGIAEPRTVLTVALAFFGLAALAGLAIVVLTGHWWLLIVGAVAIAAAYFYTGGKRPYGYAGLGELVVFVFFGLVATAGTTFVLSGRVSSESWIGGAAAGFLACAVLMVNNIRDIEQDRRAGKKTLAVRLGSTASRVVFVLFLVFAYAILGFYTLFFPLAGYVFFTLLLTAPAAIITVTARTPGELILALQLTSIGALFFGFGLGWAFAF